MSTTGQAGQTGNSGTTSAGTAQTEQRKVEATAPERIYLQIGEDCDGTEDFAELCEVCWCADQINDNDIPYVRADLRSSGAGDDAAALREQRDALRPTEEMLEAALEAYISEHKKQVGRWHNDGTAIDHRVLISEAVCAALAQCGDAAPAASGAAQQPHVPVAPKGERYELTGARIVAVRNHPQGGTAHRELDANERAAFAALITGGAA